MDLIETVSHCEALMNESFSNAYCILYYNYRMRA